MTEDPPMTVRDVIEDFWFDWEIEGKSPEELRSELIDAGCDPGASFRRVRLMILEHKANSEFEKGLSEANKNLIIGRE